MDRLKEVSPSLKRLGRKLPSQSQLDGAIHRGELAASVPLIDLEAYHEQTGGKNQALTVAVPQQAATERVSVEREATAQDIPTLQSRSLSGFAVTFTDIPIPKKGDLDEAGLGANTHGITSQLELSQIEGKPPAPPSAGLALSR